MITTPTWQTIPALGTTATKNVTGLDQANLYAPGVLFPAEHLNQFTYWFSNNGNVSQTALTSTLLESQNAVTATGQALAPADNFQLAKTIIALSHQVGELINTEIPLTPAIWTSGSATYVPVIARWDSDHDVTSAQAPDLVTKYRAVTASINVNGVATSAWTGTVTGTTTLTLASNAANLALLNLIVNEGTANGYIATQTAGASAVYTGTAQRCLTLAGVEYPITNASVGGLTITLGGSPPNATYTGTVLLYPYRIAGSTTSIRLPRLSGFVGVAQYDYDGAFVAGFRKMDQMQGHWHDNWGRTDLTLSGGGGTQGLAAGTTSGALGTQFYVRSPSTDGTNGTPRTGSTTRGKRIALNFIIKVSGS